MGLIYAEITLSNARKPEIRPIAVRALVDTGAVHLCIPKHISLQLDLDSYEEREVEIADGSVQRRSYVGPILTAFENRRCLTGAMVLGNEVLLGAIPLEDMDLVVNLARQEITVNPANPNLAVSKAKPITRPEGRGLRNSV
ncbi:Clan AA aspartic protease, AF_0612 family [Gammaproteobacteria bacterium]